MPRVEEAEVLVVGAGPVGLLAASLLAKYGVRVHVIDQEERTATHSNACVLHPRSLEILHRAGVAEKAIRLGNRIDAIRFYEGHSCTAEVELSGTPSEFPFALVLKQGELETVLEEGLRDFEHVTVGWNHRLDDLELKDGTAVASIEEFQLSGKGYVVPEFEWEVKKTDLLVAQFVIGADGHNSIVRQRLNIHRMPAGKPELYVMYNAECERPIEHVHEIGISLDGGNISAMWPFSDVTCRWGFQWTPADEPGNYPEKYRSPFNVLERPGSHDSKHHLEKMLRMRGKWFHSGIKLVDWATDIQFEHWLASKFGKSRCWLAGDAAHQAGPVGMQSMNEGLWEAEDLAVKIKRILREGGSLELLNAYERDHRAQWREILGLSGHLKPATSPNNWVREHSEQILCTLPASGKELAHLLGILGLEQEHAYMEVLH